MAEAPNNNKEVPAEPPIRKRFWGCFGFLLIGTMIGAVTCLTILIASSYSNSSEGTLAGIAALASLGITGLVGFILLPTMGVKLDKRRADIERLERVLQRHPASLNEQFERDRLAALEKKLTEEYEAKVKLIRAQWAEAQKKSEDERRGIEDQNKALKAEIDNEREKIKTERQALDRRIQELKATQNSLLEAKDIVEAKKLLEKKRGEVAKGRLAIQADIRRNREILAEIKAEEEELFQNQNTEIQETIRVLEEAAAATEERARQLETDLRQYENNLISPGRALRKERDREGTLLPEVHRDLSEKLTQLEELLESEKTHSILAGFVSAGEDVRQPVYELLEELDRRVYAPLPPAPFGLDADGKEVAWNTALLVAWQRQLHERATQIGLRRLEPAPGSPYDSAYHSSTLRDETRTTRENDVNTIQSTVRAGYLLRDGEGSESEIVLRKASVRRFVAYPNLEESTKV